MPGRLMASTGRSGGLLNPPLVIALETRAPAPRDYGVLYAPLMVRLPQGHLAMLHPHARRRVAIASAEDAIEIRQVAEAARVGDVDDLETTMSCTGQHGMRLLQPQLHDSLGEGHIRVMQQILHIAGRYADQLRHVNG